MNTNEILLSEIIKMKPVEFVGLAKLLGVPVVELKDPSEYTSTDPGAEADPQKYKPRVLSDVLENVMANFSKLNRTRKREIVKLVKKSNNSKGLEG